MRLFQRYLLRLVIMFFSISASSNERSRWDIEREGTFQLDEYLVGPTFGLSEPGPLEKNLASLYESLLQRCGDFGPYDEDYCYLVDIINELLLTGRTLAGQSPKSNNLPLTLASGMHPFSLANGFLSGPESFDVLYARFLIAQSLIVELIPLLPEDIVLESRDESIAWLTSFSPFSYVFRLSQLGSCVGQKKDKCERKQMAISVLKDVFSTLEGDQELLDRLQATHEHLQSLNFSSRRISLHQGLLSSVTDLSRGNLISFFSSSDHSTSRVDSVQIYIESIPFDALIHPVIRYEFTGDACKDLNGTLDLIRELDVPAFRLVNGHFECEIKDGYLSVVEGQAFDDIVRNGLLWRFTYFQLRLMLGQITDHIDSTDTFRIQQVYYQSLLNDINRVKSALAQYPEVEELDPDFKQDQRILWEVLLDIFDQSQNMEGGVK